MSAPRTPDAPLPADPPSTEAPLPRTRRAFLVWAVLAGLAKPERLTEAVLRDVEREGDA